MVSAWIKSFGIGLLTAIVLLLRTLLLWLPSLLYRHFVVSFVGRFKREKGDILGHIASIITDDFTQTPINFSIVALLKFEQALEINRVRELVQENVINAKHRIDGSSGRLRYPELQQYQTLCMGYMYWAWDPNFSVRDHINHRQDFPGQHLPPLHVILEQVLSRTYRQRKSPWEMDLITSGMDTECYLVLKLHHSMADAKSIVKLVVECLGGKTGVTSVEANYPKRTISNWIFSYPLQLVRAGMMLSEFTHAIVSDRDNPGTDKMGKKRGFLVRCSPQIPLQVVKSISQKTGVRASSVILSVISGSLGSIKGIQDGLADGDHCVKAMVVLPRENHPSTFANHFYTSFYKLPCGEDDSLVRLQKCDNWYNSVRGSSSLLPEATNCLYAQVASLPDALRETPSGIRGIPVLLTNIAGEQSGFDVDGTSCSDFSLITAATDDTFGLVVCVFSYKGFLRVSLVGRSDIVSAAQLEHSIVGIMTAVEELNILD